MALPSQDGLQWNATLFDLLPEWTREPLLPAIETVCRRELGITAEETCDVTFLASGLFNKLYTVQRAAGRPLIMRISLPVYPHHKTRAEVATLRWVRENTTIPVPEVFAFDDSNENFIGFEWILMELMDGTPAHKQWCNMSMEQKVAFTEQVAGYQAELSTFGKMPQHEFRGIGTLDAQTDVPGLLVSPGFFMGEHLHYDIPRGPFRSSHDWLCTELNIILQHQAAILKTSDDEDDIEDAENALSAAQKLLALVPSVFPSDLEEPEATALYHHDLHLNNILVDDHGKITAVLDWECVSAMPLWMTANLPKFLEGPEREEEPNPDGYLDAKAGQEPPLGGREKNELYYIHQMEYEATQLRKVYIARLKELWPGWPMEESHAEIDMFHAIEQCDGIWAKRVGRWADRMLNGEKIRFDIDNP